MSDSWGVNGFVRMQVFIDFTLNNEIKSIDFLINYCYSSSMFTNTIEIFIVCRIQSSCFENLVADVSFCNAILMFVVNLFFMTYYHKDNDFGMQ